MRDEKSKSLSKKAMLKNAVGRTKHYAGRAKKELSETAENKGRENAQDFVQKQLETGAGDAGSAIHNTLRTSYAQYRWTQKTQQTIMVWKHGQRYSGKR